jgi:hypothetical protein
MNFAPRGWAFCDGQVSPINQNQPLYSLLGTTYGAEEPEATRSTPREHHVADFAQFAGHCGQPLRAGTCVIPLNLSAVRSFPMVANYEYLAPERGRRTGAEPRRRGSATGRRAARLRTASAAMRTLLTARSGVA